MDKQVFHFTSYKTYLQHRAGAKRQRRGVRSAMAEILKCQRTYVSLVLNGNADFSPEQAEVLNRFFGHSEDEALFFMLLVHKERAGTQALKQFYQKQLDEILAKRMAISERLGQKVEFTSEQQATYYSSWHYAAIHVALTVPTLRTVDALAKHFRVSSKKIKDVLKFLVHSGLAQTNGVEFETGAVQIHLGSESRNILKHHSHWRQQAIESLDREEPMDLHYSTIISLSWQDVARIKEKILEEIKANQAIVKDSKVEELYAYTIDFFR